LRCDERILFRSFAGYRLTVGGLAPLAARYAGFSSRRALWMSLLISGGFAGLAGAFEVAGPIGQVLPSISPGYGFAAIIVAFIGRLSPFGTLLGGLVLSLFYLGGEMAQSRLGSISNHRPVSGHAVIHAAGL
jgi:simple sugar transport system permease protein